MRAALSHIPLLPILIGLVLGITLSELLPFIFISIIIACGILLLFTKKHLLVIISFAIALGWICKTTNSAVTFNENLIDKELLYSGTVVEVKNGDAIRNMIIELDVAKDSATNSHLNGAKCALATPTLNPVVEIGDNISFVGTLNYIEDRRDLPDEFDLVKYYHQQGVFVSTFLYPENILVTGTAESILWDIKRLRNELTNTIASLPLSDNCIEFLNATITGDTSMIDEEQRLKYSTSGLAHVLALSGLHVGIISFILAITLLPLDLLLWRKTRFVITILLLWFYAIMTGLSPSVTRAVIMASVFLIAYIIQRNNNPFNSLCLAALIILTFSPDSLYNIGFQLSFTAVASILLFANKLNPINPRRRVLFTIFSLITVSVSAMLGTGIVAAFYFHNFPVYFLIANVASSYLLPVIIAGGALAIAFSYLGIDVHLLCYLIDFLYTLIDSLTTFITTLPGAKIDNIYFNGWLQLPYFATIVGIYASIVYRRLVWYIITGALIVFGVVILTITRPQYPITEYYIPRNTYYTNIIVRDTTALYVISTAHGGDSIDAYNKCIKQYQDYMGWRNVDTTVYVPAKFESKRLICNNGIVAVGNDVLIVVDDDSDVSSYNIKPQYAIVCRGFKGNIYDVYNTLKPDTIILSRDLHKKRMARYIDSCEIHNIPYLSLREKGFHRVIINQ